MNGYGALKLKPQHKNQFKLIVFLRNTYIDYENWAQLSSVYMSSFYFEGILKTLK